MHMQSYDMSQLQERDWILRLSIAATAVRAHAGRQPISEGTELVVSLTAAQGGHIPKVGRSWRGELALLCDFPDAKRIAR